MGRSQLLRWTQLNHLSGTWSFRWALGLSCSGRPVRRTVEVNGSSGLEVLRGSGFDGMKRAGIEVYSMLKRKCGG